MNNKEIKLTENCTINGIKLPETPKPEIRYDGIFPELKLFNWNLSISNRCNFNKNKKRNGLFNFK